MLLHFMQYCYVSFIIFSMCEAVHNISKVLNTAVKQVTCFQTVNCMEMGMTPEQIYGQNVYVPATANSYPYGYTGKNMNWQLAFVHMLSVVLYFSLCCRVVIHLLNAEVGSPTEWYNNQSSLGYDGQDIYFPVSTHDSFSLYFPFPNEHFYLVCLITSQGFQTEGTKCMYYAAPDNGSVHPSYSPYPINSSFIVDGSYLPLEYVGDAADQTCQIVPSPYYVPTILPYAHDNVLGNTTAPLHPPVYVPTLPSYAVTSTNHALPSVPPVATKNDIIANPPIQSTIVASKQFLDHASDPKVQLRNPIPLKKELADGSMMPVKYPHTSQVGKSTCPCRSSVSWSALFCQLLCSTRPCLLYVNSKQL